MPYADYYTLNREKVIARAIKWQEDNHDRYISRLHAWRARLKRETMEIYGDGTGDCIECRQREATQLHHTNGDGENHRAEVIRPRVGGINFYLKLKKLGWPDRDVIIAVCKDCHEELEKILRQQIQEAA